jgi:predicted helicase
MLPLRSWIFYFLPPRGKLALSNNGFIDQLAFDGMRKHLLQDFDRVFVFDLQGNIRRDSMRDGIPLGEKHTVFGLAAMVGITITILVRNKKRYEDHRLYYQTVDWRATRDEKFAVLEKHKSALQVDWTNLAPDNRYSWLVPENADEFATFVPMGSKEAKSAKVGAEETIFAYFSRGLETTRDDWVYNFQRDSLERNVKGFIEKYNSEVDRWRRANRPKNIDDFVDNDSTKIKWSSRLKETLVREQYAIFADEKIRKAVYRPYSKKYVFFDEILNHRRGLFPLIFPTLQSESENLTITISDIGSRANTFSALISNVIPDLHLCAAIDAHQSFPFYVYDEDGTNRRENITDWALSHFQQQYADPTITKWDIFYYIYALLHHPAYRERFAANLKRELPRIPMVGRGTQDAETTTPDTPLSTMERVLGGEVAVSQSSIPPSPNSSPPENHLPPCT